VDEPPLEYGSTTDVDAAADIPARILLWRAFVRGGACAFVVGLCEGVAYFVSYKDEIAMDWARVGSLFVVATILLGGTFAVGALGGMIATRRFDSRLATFLGAAAGGALAPSIPGALSSLYFGSRTAPFMGTAAIALGPVACALAIAVAVADIDARSRGETQRVAGLAFRSLVAAIPFVAGAIAVTWAVSDEAALARMRAWATPLENPLDSVRYGIGLALVGFFLSIVLGGLLGLHVAATTIVARARRRS
jgi:hypothetical protein